MFSSVIKVSFNSVYIGAQESNIADFMVTSDKLWNIFSKTVIKLRGTEDY